MGRKREDEIDGLQERCDNLQRMLADLAEKLGQFELARDMAIFHNKCTAEIINRRGT